MIFDDIEQLQSYFESGFGDIPEERQSLLTDCAASIADQLIKHSSTSVVVICTHNSRRSQLGELMIACAAKVYGIDSLKSYSGGSEATAFNYRMVNALIREGISFQLLEAGENPRYVTSLAGESFENEFFSKKYDHSFNPKQNFVAVLVCNSADKACPNIIGASARYFIPYVDPKVSDDSPKEAEVYGAKVIEIGREMFYMIKQVKQKLQ